MSLLSSASINQRLRGFVIGYDTGSDGIAVWKVRVKEGGGILAGQKLSVASVHGNIQLARGLNVDFLIGSIDGPNGGKHLRAVDVKLDN